MRYVNAPNTAFGEDRRSYKTGTNGVTSNQTVFNVSYDNGRVEAYLNGVRLYPGDDFTKTSSGIGTSITLASAIGASNVLEIVGYQGINSGNALVEDNFVVGTGSTGSGGTYTNSTTVFPVASSAGDTVSVWRNGVKLVPTTDYTVDASASTVTLPTNQAASVGDEVTVQVVGGVIHNNGLTVNSGNDSYFLPTTRGADTYVLTRDDTLGDGGTTWKETVSPPSITNVTGEINEDTNTTLTVTGSNFSTGMTLKLINSSTSADITGHTTLSYTGSSSPLTVTIPSATTNITAGTQVKLYIEKQGLTTTSNVITVSEDPNWVTNAGNIATIYSSRGTSTNVGSALSATAGAGGGTINYVIDSSDTSATTYFDLGLTSGQITTDASNALSGILGGGNGPVTETFIAYAQIDGEEATKKAPRTFNIIVNKAPTGGDNIYTYQHGGSGAIYRVHLFTTTGTTLTFECFNNIIGADILIVGGGGAGGNGLGGGGAGGVVQWATNYTITSGSHDIFVGAGASEQTGANNSGDSGSASTFHDGSQDIKALGGGGGAGEGKYVPAPSGNPATNHSNTGGTSYNNAPNDGRVPVVGPTYAGWTAYHNKRGGHPSSANMTGLPSGGGAGAGADGGDASNNQGGAGGNGIQIAWTTPRALKNTTSTVNGTTVDAGFYWAGGGGGSIHVNSGTSGTGTHGGGGGAANTGSTTATNSSNSYAFNTGASGTTAANHADGGAGGANTGAGGGGGTDGEGHGGAGGSGIVVIRYEI